MANTDRLDRITGMRWFSNGVPVGSVPRAHRRDRQREPVRQAEDLRTVLRFVRFQYDCTVIDLGRGMNPMVLSALEEVDEAFLVTTLDVPALHQAQTDRAQPAGARIRHPDRLRLVLNRVPRSPDVLPSELEELLGIPVYALLPDDYASVYEAYSEGSCCRPVPLWGGNWLAGGQDCGHEPSQPARRVLAVRRAKELETTNP